MASDRPAAPAAPWGILAPALAAGLAAYAVSARALAFVCDDAYITFRYARNWAEGHGLVYHVGTDAPVEGYSELLWALLVGLGMRAGVAPEVTSQAVSSLAGAAMVALVAWLAATRWAPSRGAAVVAAVFAGAAPPVAAWATGGMATMPACLLALALFAAVTGEPWPGRSLARRALGPAALASLLALTRADGALLVALVLGPVIAAGAVAAAHRPAALRALVAAAVSAGAFAAHVAWRVSAYGDWLPNTARAKLGFGARAAERGLDYLAWNALAMPGLALGLGLAVVGVLRVRREVGAPAAASALALLVGVPAYAVATGGDFMCFARFLLPAVPLAALGVGAAAHAIRPGALGLAAGALCVATSAPATFGVDVLPHSLREPFHFRHNQRLGGVEPTRSEREQWEQMVRRAEEWGVMGRALGEHAAPGDSVVYGAVGAIGYFSRLRVFDRNGLVTREVALRPAPDELRSPGHDKNVPPGYFLREGHRPTWLGVALAPAEAAAAARARGYVVIGPTERQGEVLLGVPGPDRR